MAAINNVSPSFLWLATRETSSSLFRNDNGVGDLSTCPLNATGVNSPQNGGAFNSKHASVTAHPSGEGFVLHRLTRGNTNKPAKRYSATHINNLKPGQVDLFRNLIKKQINRRDLNTVSTFFLIKSILRNKHVVFMMKTLIHTSSATDCL